jgi:glutathione peroxidase
MNQRKIVANTPSLACRSRGIALLGALACGAAAANSPLLVTAEKSPASVAAAAACPAILNHQTKTLRGQALDLCAYRGKVVVAVNTASYCGFTQQYKALEALQRKYRNRGLVVVGFPTNDFGAQEPGSNAEVAEFCERTFQVSFPMAEKSTLKGGAANPFFARLAEKSMSPAKWNFHKYVVDRTGKVVAFASQVSPDSPEFVTNIELALAAK